MTKGELGGLALIEQRLKSLGCRKSGNDWTCPAHDDRKPSLTVKKGDSQPVILACPKCDTSEVLAALGLTWEEIHGGSDPVVIDRHEYVYRDKRGSALFRVTRLTMSDGSKSFKQQKAKPGGGWEGTLGGAKRKRVLYQLPSLRSAIDSGHTIHLTEGEKDAEALIEYFKAHGLSEFATCHSGGGGKWNVDGSAVRYLKNLRGSKLVVIWADRDSLGFKDALERCESVRADGHLTEIRLPIPTQPKADVYDHLQAGHGPEDGVSTSEAELIALLELSRIDDLASWGPQDLSAVLDGTFEQPEPTVGKRSGNGVGLFYPGKFHLLVSESEAGKTWLSLHVAIQEIELRRHVFYFDFEDDGPGIVSRLLLMGADEDLIREFFHYSRPEHQFDTKVREGVVALLRRTEASFVVVDGVTEIMTQHRWGQNANDDVAAFYQQVLRPMADTGAAVVALDHLPKSEENTSRRGPIGGVHKLNGVNGAVYRMKAIRPMAPGKEGLSAVSVDKDRMGQVRKHQDSDKRVADLIVDSDEDSVLVALEAPSESGRIEGERSGSKVRREEEKRALARDLLERFVRDQPGVGKKDLLRGVKGNGPGEEVIKEVLARLVDPDDIGSIVVVHGKSRSQSHYLSDSPATPHRATTP